MDGGNLHPNPVNGTLDLYRKLTKFWKLKVMDRLDQTVIDSIEKEDGRYDPEYLEVHQCYKCGSISILIRW